MKHLAVDYAPRGLRRGAGRRVARPLGPPPRRARPSPPRRSASGRGPGSAARMPATSRPVPAAPRRRRRRRAEPTRAASPAPARRAASTSAAGDVSRHDQGDVEQHGRERRDLRRGRGRGRLERVEVELHGAGALRQAQSRDDARMQLAGVADDARRPARSSAHRPGCHGGWSPRRTVSSVRAARATTRAASTASAQSAGRPVPHQPARSRGPDSTTATCRGWSGRAAFERRQLRIGRPVRDARPRHGGRVRAREVDQSDLEQATARDCRGRRCA